MNTKIKQKCENMLRTLQTKLPNFGYGLMIFGALSGTPKAMANSVTHGTNNQTPDTEIKANEASEDFYRSGNSYIYDHTSKNGDYILEVHRFTENHCTGGYIHEIANSDYMLWKEVKDDGSARYTYASLKNEGDKSRYVVTAEGTIDVPLELKGIAEKRIAFIESVIERCCRRISPEKIPPEMTVLTGQVTQAQHQSSAKKQCASLGAKARRHTR